MTQTDIPTWCLNFQLALMAALDAAWKSIEASTDPAVLRQARDKAKAIGDLAAMARKVALITPRDRAKPAGPTLTDVAAAGLAATQGVANVSAMLMDSLGPAAPVAAQAEPARRALDKLKGGRRGRL
ncbi:hypothetical protein ASD79_04315 [Caulobacter sp. Root655]|uniref:hypothetical protein n=1 Tax=Caulobacter sp. Root655 TaxID=1736578 RepID=UPI0006F72C2D|nr:hypothetical protein [Caulobacter sp. Root655]KRA66493.1 hypothetical protein ASD79_04315 [Caulobacter sp. Root655]